MQQREPHLLLHVVALQQLRERGDDVVLEQQRARRLVERDVDKRDARILLHPLVLVRVRVRKRLRHLRIG